MADISPDWANRPGSDPALSSDEDDFVSSQSTASAGPDTVTKHQLPIVLSTLHLTEMGSSQSSDPSASTSTPGTGVSTYTTSPPKQTRKRMNILDLPLDVLKEIIKEITHTNDLTSLALTCSALNGLAVPHMYSRFDIVWPESLNPTTDDYTGVDALSYGLSTLVMGEDVFNQVPFARQELSAIACSQCGCCAHGRPPSNEVPTPKTNSRSRRGNNYAQYTRTFSIGNGPLSWVQEYSVNKEVGKMLGTLVALAVARMTNLESFIWDMPTGVVREIWLALASLADRPDYQSRLERVWVRWHDNSENVLRVAAAPMTGSRLLQRYQHVEHPSLSVLPPLKSVAVLDIDEPAYVEELAVLIERSRHRLVELRIGIAAKAHMSTWLVCAKDTDTLTSSNWPKIGGVLSILSKRPLPAQEEQMSTSSPTPDLSIGSEISSDLSGEDPGAMAKGNVDINTQHDASSLPSDETQLAPRVQESVTSEKSNSPKPPAFYTQIAHDKLNLQVLELERVPLSVSNLLPTLDWTRLNTLTLMRCEDHEHLWRALRRKYAPPATPTKKFQNGDRSRARSDAAEYPLNLKHLRTDTVSPYLMLFIKDALAPNTLESVYLHEVSAYESSVQVDAIHRHILRKHRLSLRKILIDASERQATSENQSVHWQKWMFNHEMISFVTSGRMPQLKELGMAMHYRDWHYFLQRLPNMPQLRALYLPHINHSVHRELKELALQVLDIVSIRPELKITYIGLQTKCYQILEGNSEASDPDFPPEDPAIDPGQDPLIFNGMDDDEDDPLDPDLSSDLSDSDFDETHTSRVRFGLREILFYDDKISIFKARHGVRRLILGAVDSVCCLFKIPHALQSGVVTLTPEAISSL